MSTKIFVPFNIPPEQIGELEQAIEGKEATLSVLPKDLEKEKQHEYILQEIAETEVFFNGQITQEQYAAAKKLKWIQVPFAGVNNLLSLTELIDSPITVTNGAGVMAPALSDQVMGYIISFSRRLPQQFALQQRKEWGRMQGPDYRLIELAGRTLGIIGYGRIGSEIAKRAKAFGMKVIATKNTTEGDYPNLDLVLPNGELGRLLAESDYVVISAPLTPETQGLIGRTELEQMKPGAYLINIARGALVKEAELIEVLREKRIAGAALDVFEKEPLPSTSPLWDLDNVILTPHSSGNFDGFLARSVSLFADNIRRYLNGQPLVNLVDKKRGY